MAMISFSHARKDLFAACKKKRKENAYAVCLLGDVFIN